MSNEALVYCKNFGVIGKERPSLVKAQVLESRSRRSPWVCETAGETAAMTGTLEEPLSALASHSGNGGRYEVPYESLLALQRTHHFLPIRHVLFVPKQLAEVRTGIRTDGRN